MYSREPRTNLPQVGTFGAIQYDEELRDTDAVTKCRKKMYVDEKRGAKEKNLESAGRVLAQKRT